MSSYPRNLQRKQLRKSEDYQPVPQSFITGDTPYRGSNRAILRAFKRDLQGGYVTIRHTKGPLRVSARRLLGQGAMAHFEQYRQGREMQKMMAVAMTPRQPDAVPGKPARITRQMLRYAARKGLPVPVMEAVAEEWVATPEDIPAETNDQKLHRFGCDVEIAAKPKRAKKAKVFTDEPTVAEKPKRVRSRKAATPVVDTSTKPARKPRAKKVAV